MTHTGYFTSTPIMKPLSTRRSTTLSVLDIGVSKVVCLIAELHPTNSQNHNGHTHTAQIIGIGHQTSTGLKGGVVVDMDAAEYAIRHAVSAAERMARVEVRSVIVNVSGGRLASTQTSSEINLKGTVDHNDVADILERASQNCGHPSRALIHSLPLVYQLDGQNHIIDPIGMAGEKLAAKLHLVDADTSVIKNLTLAVERSRLAVDTFVATPYASGLATLSDDETDMGCVLIDIGSGTTDIGVFDEGYFVHADALAIGGNHITMDIARGLTTRFSVAERLKITHGSAFWTPQDDRELIAIPHSSAISHNPADGSRHIQKGQLARIIQPRVEEILEFTRDRLHHAGFSRHMKQRVIFTGGTSQLGGLLNIASHITGGPSRIAHPNSMKGLPEAARNTLFSTALGLLIYPQFAQMEYFSPHNNRKYAATGTDGYFSKVGRWIKDSF